MISNYLKMAWRSLVKNRLASFINIFGLAIGLSVSLIIFLSITSILSFNKFHEHYDDIHLLMKTQRGTEVTTGSSVPGLLGPTVKAEMPEVKYAARGAFDEPQLTYGDKSIYQLTLYTDPEFFDFMTFPAISGDPMKGMHDPNSIVLTESAAKRLFGNTDPVGKTVTQNSKNDLKVIAVIKDVPFNSMYQFDAVIPFSFYAKDKDWISKWDNNRILTWVELQPKTTLSLLNKKLNALIKEKSGDNKEELFAYPLKDVWLNNSFTNGHPEGGRIQGVILLAIVGLFVLMIACINFMNLSTARSEQRFREAGVRRTLGASRVQLITQFLGEAFLLTFFSMILGVILSKLFLPYFNRVSDGHLTLDLANRYMLAALAGIGLFTALVAGSYPALFLTRPQPVSVLKGVSVSVRGGSLLRRGLVTFQFVITIALIISTLVVLKQEHHMEERPIGYDQENLVDIPARGELSAKFELVRNALVKIPGVTSVSAGNDDLVQFGGGTDGIQWPGKTAGQDFYVKVTNVSYEWIKTAGLQLTEGRDFSRNYGADTLSCLITETGVRKMNLKEPVVGTKLGDNTIIGVVKDFMFNDVFENPDPMVIYLSTGPMNHFLVRIKNSENWRQTMAQVEKSVKEISPEFPFDYRFTSAQYERQFYGIRNTVTMLNYAGVLTILISCMGLFGLSTFLSERRAKEMGIRKILGAGIRRIWFLLSADFLKPVALAFLVGAPLSGWAMHEVLGHFDYRIALTWDIFATAGLAALTIALLTVSFQGVRSALSNPVDALRSE